MNNAIIRTQNLAKTYQSGAVETHALRGITVEIPRGTFCAVVGPSGHGKSTFMHLIGGLDRATGGSVHIDGEDLTRMGSRQLADLRARKTGFVFQFFNLLRNLSAEENVEAALMFSRIPEPKQRDRARELLELVGLSGKLRSRPSELSGGQQQRVAIARAMANDPEILLMDEPTGNLDSSSEAEVLEIVDTLHRSGKTVVIVTHNNDIASRAQQVVTIRDGRLAP